ncbi:MAG TPA: hypothetical protein VGA67_03840 [Candidatus Dojkabacteria bacterium]|jgi:hypothetical protein
MNQDDNSGDYQSLEDPSEETKRRIGFLADVGLALYETANETSYETNIFLAKDALLKFKAGIDKLELDPKTRKGINVLIEKLQKEIDERLNDSY